MIFGNTQVSYTLPPALDGVEQIVAGQELFHTPVISPLVMGTGKFTLSELSSCFIPTNNNYPKNIPVYIDGSSKANGQLHGGLCVSLVPPDSFGSNYISYNYIGDAVINLTPLLDQDHNEILKTNGDNIYVLASVNSSLLSDGNYLVDRSLQLSFVSYDEDGVLQPELVVKGDYTYTLNGVYAWSVAMLKGIVSSTGGGGGSSPTPTLAGSSREEVIKLVDDDKVLQGYCAFKYLTDSNLDPDEGYVAKFVLYLDGSREPTFSIKGSTTGNTGASGVITYEGKGIKATTGSGNFSDITFYLNGDKARASNVEVIVTGQVVEIILDNSNMQLAYGEILSGDIFEISYVTRLPTPPKAPILALDSVNWIGTTDYIVNLSGMQDFSGTMKVTVIINDNVTYANLHNVTYVVEFDGNSNTNDNARGTVTNNVYNNRSNSTVTVETTFDNGTTRTQVFNF